MVIHQENENQNCNEILPPTDQMTKIKTLIIPCTGINTEELGLLFFADGKENYYYFGKHLATSTKDKF